MDAPSVNHCSTVNPPSAQKGPLPLHLQIRTAESQPWPGLSIHVHALLPGLNGAMRVPFDELEIFEGAYRYESSVFKPDAVDALLLRTLTQLPRCGSGEYVAGARDFARVLALLRQASPHCETREEGRVARVELLDEPVRAALHIAPVSGSLKEGALDAANLRLHARVSFRDADSGAPLSHPISRDGSYWTFERVVTPPPLLPDDALLRSLIEKPVLEAPEFTGIEALDLLCRARACARNFEIHFDPAIQTLNLNLEPLRENIDVRLNDQGEVEIVRALATAQGRAVDFPSAMAGAAQVEKAQAAKDGRWLELNGERHRLPENFSGGWLHRHLSPELPRDNAGLSRHRIAEDGIPAFVLDVLPKLKKIGAKVARAVEEIGVCLALKPSLNVRTIEGDGGGCVRASFHFEAAAPFRNGASSDAAQISPFEILEAAAQQKTFLRRGNAFYRVDSELVAHCRSILEAGVGLGSGAVGGEFEARDEQIPRLLEFARKAAHDDHTPWNCYVSESVDGAHKIKDEQATVRVQLDVDEDEGKDAWFTLNASFDHGGVKLSEEEMRRLADEGREWFNQNGTWIHVDKKALARFDKQVSESGVQALPQHAPLFGFHSPKRRRKFYYRFRPDQREKIDQVFSIAGTVQHNERYKRFLDQLLGFDNILPLELPKSMKLTPRPYQQRGFEWLAFLARYGLNGVLADDMGLGKTAQTIAQLTRMKDQFGFMPSLIVTPTSLSDNWRREFEKFSPQMRVMIYRGSPAKRDKLRGEVAPPEIALGAMVDERGDIAPRAPGADAVKACGFDIVLATFATVRNDASLLSKLPWRYVIVDEAHFIKNSAAGVAKAVKTIPAKHRLALTGTPIQNRLSELWSLFDFLMPGFLGRQAHFTQQFEDPISRMQSGRAESAEEHETGRDAAGRLREKIFPFVLRRLKSDVAKDLPPKIESDIFCALTPEQRALYQSFGESEEARRAVGDIAERGESNSPAILAALISLRKICNHPDLMYLPKNSGRQHVTEPIPGYENRSGKLEALGELLEQCREGGHRALIFCQLTSMLDIIGHFVKGKGLKYLRIDGETPGMLRQGLVEQFNGDANIDAFLISTRAGGSGLNLTGADTVIFYDHDWNPANDQQAQDRAYRIGQTRAVNVYRLICKGTLEEKILRRQVLKKALANSIVTHDASGMKDLSREELLSLFTLSGE